MTDGLVMMPGRSLRRAETSLTHLLAHFGPARVVTVTGDRVSAYIRARLEVGAAPATIRNELAALKRMFTLGVRAGKVTHRPHIPAIQVSNARQGFFEAADFAAVYAELPDYLQPVAEFCYLTGWRSCSEVLPLKWAQVDLAAGVVRLEPGTTKNDAGRTFPCDARPIFRRCWRRSATGPSRWRRPRVGSFRTCSTTTVRRSAISAGRGARRSTGRRTRTAWGFGSSSAPRCWAASRTTSAAPPSATLCALACPSAWLCN